MALVMNFLPPLKGTPDSWVTDIWIIKQDAVKAAFVTPNIGRSVLSWLE